MAASESPTEPAFAYARSGIVPVRAQTEDASEMLTQLLLGETVVIDAEAGRWYHVTADYDGYKGWVNRNQLQLFDATSYAQWKNHPRRHRSPYAGIRIRNKDETLWLPVGAYVVFENDGVHLPDTSFDYMGEPKLMRHESILETARAFLGTPYLWGGRSDAGIDCSGFIQTVYALHGSDIPRDSGIQFSAVASPVKEIEDARAGDIIYFNTSGDRVTHVGFYAGEGILLHASGNVKQNLIHLNYHSNIPLTFDQRLAEHIAGIQSGRALFEYGREKSRNGIPT